MTLAEDRIFRARRAEWTTDEDWQTKVHVCEQFTSEVYAETHRFEGTTPCAYAATTIYCERCQGFEKQKKQTDD